MMMNLPENYINRIDIPVDWSKCTGKGIAFLRVTIDLGNIQLNAECNNRLGYIAELERDMAATKDPSLHDAIEDVIRVVRLQIEIVRRRGVFQDYGYLKRRIAEGASADEVYPIMPSAYAMATDRVRRINARTVKHQKPLLAFIGGTTLIGVLADLITIKDSDLANRIKELIQEILRM
ncbi:MAG: hypothetical protein OXD31_04965 [Chloroflexi bacterium]|nr:hypothetical protein [Chloroflexota bacterium]